ncbi:MAG: hypothetical protein ACQERN_04820 [Thermodesulfobacteriota bacterium]
MGKKFGLILAVLLLFPTEGFSSGIDIIGDNAFVISYQISLNGQNKGYMEIEKNGNHFSSQYYHITRNDQIPFYAQSKSGKLKDNLYATELKFNGRHYRVFNDLTQQAPENLPSFLQSDDSKAKRAVLVNQSTGRIELSFEKIPMVTFENIIIGFLSDRIESKQPLMLYEGGNDIKMKVFFKKEKIADSSRCVAAKYSCFRQNVPGQSSKFLFDILVNKDGIPIEAASKSRWKFRIDKIGRIKTVSKDIRPYLAEKAQRKTRDIFSMCKARINQLDITNFEKAGRDFYNYDYQLDIHFLPDPDHKYEALKYLCEQVDSKTKCSGDTSKVSVSGGQYLIRANRDETCGVLRQMADIDNCESSVQSEYADVSASRFLQVIAKEVKAAKLQIRSESWYKLGGYFIENAATGEKIDLDMDEACRLFLSHQYPEKTLEYRNHSVINRQKEIQRKDENGTVRKKWEERPVRLEIDYVSKTPVSSDYVSRAAKQVIYEKLFGRGIDSRYLNNYDMQLKKDGARSFHIAVSRAKINDIIEQKRQSEYNKLAQTSANITNRKTLDANGLYRLSGHGRINMETLNEYILDELIGKHPRLEYTTGEIKKEKTSWVFPVIASEVSICK